MKTVRDQALYLQTQMIQMKIYLNLKRNIGDSRNKNLIYLEWIENNAIQFREDFIEISY